MLSFPHGEMQLSLFGCSVPGLHQHQLSQAKDWDKWFQQLGVAHLLVEGLLRFAWYKGV